MVLPLSEAVGAGPRGEGERISSEQFSLFAADSQDER